MPIYEYRCQKGHTFDVMQRISEDPVTECRTCGSSVVRVFHPPNVHFKGSGFYNTDYGTRKRAREKEQASKDGDGGSSSGEKSSESKSETKTEAKAGGTSAPKGDAAKAA